VSLSGAHIERADVDLRVGAAELRLVSRRAHLEEIEGWIAATRVIVDEARVQPGDTMARDVELAGSLRRRTLDRIQVREVSAAMESIERWRKRAERGWGRKRSIDMEQAPVRLRVQWLTERPREVVLRNVELSFDGGARVRARAVTVPKSGGVCLLEDVTVEVGGQRHIFEEMSLDLETLELVPRRSLVARALGQQWGGGVRLDQLEVVP